MVILSRIMKFSLLVFSLLGLSLVSSYGERGSDGELRIIYWQAPSMMNPYLSGGTKELQAASLVVEPLARYDETGALVPWLAKSVPTVENGGISSDLRTITWSLKSGIRWSNGDPVTPEDIIFTWKYCTAPDGGCAQSTNFNDVSSVEKVSSDTIKITFGVAKPFPYGPFVGAQSPILNSGQFADCVGAKAQECSEANFQADRHRCFCR